MINHRGLVYFLVLAMFPYHVQMSTDLRAVKAKPAAASVSEVINIAHAQKELPGFSACPATTFVNGT